MLSPWNPWHELAERQHLKVRWIRAGRRGCIDFTSNEITMRSTMQFEERRCVITHELVHDERGPVPLWLEPREEAAVRAESARRLIDITALADVLRWTPFIGEAAHELGVDVSTLQARLVNLTDEERTMLDTNVVDHAEEVPDGLG